MNTPSNYTSACNAANGATIVTYSAVGTKPYKTGKTYTCPQTNPGATPGSIVFNGAQLITQRAVYVNDLSVYPIPWIFTIPVKTTAFTTFKLDDRLNLHVQKWTYDATLYRDNVLVEQLSGKSPAPYSGDVMVKFTAQPDSFVHGHTWKVQWHYSGGQFTNGSTSFYIP
jgi:hypothetical protein